VTNLFQHHGVEVPPASWFKKYIPNSDPHGITYDALIRLEERAPTYSPSTPEDIWDTVPLKVLIRWYLILGCEAYKETEVHRDSCTWLDCEVCLRDEELIGDALRCWKYREWFERYQEEVMKIPQYAKSPIPGIPSEVLGEFKQRFDGEPFGEDVDMKL
jgi:hypothetical protein